MPKGRVSSYYDFDSFDPSENDIEKAQQCLISVGHGYLNTTRQAAIDFLNLIYFMAWVHEIVIDIDNIDFQRFMQKYFKIGLHHIKDPIKLAKTNSNIERIKELYRNVFTPNMENSANISNNSNNNNNNDDNNNDNNDNDNNNNNNNECSDENDVEIDTASSTQIQNKNMEDNSSSKNSTDDYNVSDFDFLMENQDNILTFRMLGNNELIFEQQCLRLRKRLEEIIEKAKQDNLTKEEIRKLFKRVRIELLGKTGTNMWFCREDILPEWYIMRRALQRVVGDILEEYNINFESITVVGDFVSTIDTIKKANKKMRKAENSGKHRIAYIGCPNTDIRQEVDIELMYLQLKIKLLEKEKELENLGSGHPFKRRKLGKEIEEIRQQIPFGDWSFDNCGGMEKVQKDLLDNAINFSSKTKITGDQEKTTLGNPKNCIEKNKGKRFVRVTYEFNKFLISNMFCEMAKCFYALNKIINVWIIFNILKTERDFNNSQPMTHTLHSHS